VNVTINSTINHLFNPLSMGNLRIRSTNSTTITKAIGAADNVTVSNSGAGGINITGNVTSDLDGLGIGGIFITNSGVNAPTSITGGLLDASALSLAISTSRRTARRRSRATCSPSSTTSTSSTTALARLRPSVRATRSSAPTSAAPATSTSR